MIEVENLTRVFRIYKKPPGFWAGVRGLFHREFEELAAAKDISFSIREGEFVGFLGPNGAGKTTTLKMLAGLIHPTSGHARVAGYEPGKRENDYRRIFALVLGQKNQLWWDLPAQESFLLLRHIYGIPAAQFQATLDELVDLLGVREKLRTMVRELSLGERMKMELIAALLHRPKVLFLDEPTIGLDVISQRAVRNFLRDYNRRYRTTILLTSHYMADIQELCDRVIVIDKGRKIYDGDLDLLQSAGGRKKIVRFRPVELPFSGIDQFAAYAPQATEDGEIILHVPNPEIVVVTGRILAAGAVADIAISDVPLEDIIADLFNAQPAAASVVAT